MAFDPKDNKEDRPRTHVWRRPPGEARPPRPIEGPRPIRVRVPPGEAPAPDQLANSLRQAFKDWPIVILRLVLKSKTRENLGKHPARWFRRQLIGAVDRQLCTCEGERCIREACQANLLLGRHGRATELDGEAWSPFILRVPSEEKLTVGPNSTVRCRLILAGRSAHALPRLLDALEADETNPEGTGRVQWTAINALVLDEDGDLRWRKAKGLSTKEAFFPLERLPEPRVRARRLMLNFLTPTPLSRRGERGTPNANLALIVDRMTRSLGAWMGRTGHRGPRIPVDDCLRAVAKAKLQADHTRVVGVPELLLGTEGSRREGPPEHSEALQGSATWTGDFRGLEPLLRVVHYVGMGPGRQHGLGDITVR